MGPRDPSVVEIGSLVNLTEKTKHGGVSTTIKLDSEIKLREIANSTPGSSVNTSE